MFRRKVAQINSQINVTNIETTQNKRIVKHTHYAVGAFFITGRGRGRYMPNVKIVHMMCVSGVEHMSPVSRSTPTPIFPLSPPLLPLPPKLALLLGRAWLCQSGEKYESRARAVIIFESSHNFATVGAGAEVGRRSMCVN